MPTFNIGTSCADFDLSKPTDTKNMYFSASSGSKTYYLAQNANVLKSIRNFTTRTVVYWLDELQNSLSSGYLIADGDFVFNNSGVTADVFFKFDLLWNDTLLPTTAYLGKPTGGAAVSTSNLRFLWPNPGTLGTGTFSVSAYTGTWDNAVTTTSQYKPNTNTSPVPTVLSVAADGSFTIPVPSGTKIYSTAQGSGTNTTTAMTLTFRPTSTPPNSTTIGTNTFLYHKGDVEAHYAAGGVISDSTKRRVLLAKTTPAFSDILDAGNTLSTFLQQGIFRIDSVTSAGSTTSTLKGFTRSTDIATVFTETAFTTPYSVTYNGTISLGTTDDSRTTFNSYTIPGIGDVLSMVNSTTSSLIWGDRLQQDIIDDSEILLLKKAGTNLYFGYDTGSTSFRVQDYFLFANPINNVQMRTYPVDEKNYVIQLDATITNGNGVRVLTASSTAKTSSGFRPDGTTAANTDTLCSFNIDGTACGNSTNVQVSNLVITTPYTVNPTDTNTSNIWKIMGPGYNDGDVTIDPTISLNGDERVLMCPTTGHGGYLLETATNTFKVGPPISGKVVKFNCVKCTPVTGQSYCSLVASAGGGAVVAGAGASGSTVSMPAAVTGLALWYYRTDYNGSTTWTSKTPSGASAKTITMSGNPPTTTTPPGYVDFSSTGRIGTITSSGLGQAASAFTLFVTLNMFGATPISGGWSMIFATEGAWQAATTGTGATGASVHIQHNNSNVRVGVSTGATSGNEASQNIITSLNDPFVLTVKFSASTVSIYKNGTIVGSASGNLGVSTLNLSRFNIGNWSGGERPLNGAIGELAIWNSALTDANIKTVADAMVARQSS